MLSRLTAENPAWWVSPLYLIRSREFACYVKRKHLTYISFSFTLMHKTNHQKPDILGSAVEGWGDDVIWHKTAVENPLSPTKSVQLRHATISRNDSAWSWIIGKQSLKEIHVLDAAGRVAMPRDPCRTWRASNVILDIVTRMLGDFHLLFCLFV